MENNKLEVGQQYYDICLSKGMGGIEFSINEFSIKKINKVTLKTTKMSYYPQRIEDFEDKIENGRYVKKEEFGEKQISELKKYFEKSLMLAQNHIKGYTELFSGYKLMKDNLERLEMLSKLFEDFSFPKYEEVHKEILKRANEVGKIAAEKMFG